MLVLILFICAASAVAPSQCNHTAAWRAGEIPAEQFTGPQSCAHVKCTGNSTFVCAKIVQTSACSTVDGNLALVPAEWIRELSRFPAECRWLADFEYAAVLGRFQSSVAECCAILQYRGETVAAIVIMAVIVAGFCIFGIVHTCKCRGGPRCGHFCATIPLKMYKK